MSSDPYNTYFYECSNCEIRKMWMEEGDLVLECYNRYSRAFIRFFDIGDFTCDTRMIGRKIRKITERPAKDGYTLYNIELTGSGADTIPLTAKRKIYSE